MTAELSISYETLSALFPFQRRSLRPRPPSMSSSATSSSASSISLAAHEANVQLVQDDGRLKLSCARLPRRGGLETETRTAI